MCSLPLLDGENLEADLASSSWPNRRVKVRRKINTCHPCRRTKRWCNKARPTCSLCEHLKIKCSYLEAAHSSPTDRGAGSSAHSFSHGLLVQYGDSTKSLLKAAGRVEAQGIFWTFYLPQQEQQTALDDLFAVAPRIAELQAIAANSRPAQLALQACALTVIGHRQKDPQLLQRGMSFYGESITRLNLSLATLDPPTLRQCISTCRLLCLYEMMRPIRSQNNLSAQGWAWKNHAMATCTLADMLYASKAHDSQQISLENIQRLAFRVNFASRQTLCLKRAHGAEPTMDVHPSNLREALHELISKIPDLFAQNDALLMSLHTSKDTQSMQDRTLAALALTHNLNQLGKELCIWEHHVTKFATAESESAGFKKQSGSLFEISQNHGFGLLLSLNEYWACRAVINIQAQHLTRQLKARLGLETYLPEWMNTVQPFISDIARSAIRLLSSEAGLWISEQVCTVIATAINCLTAINALDCQEMSMLQIAIDNNQQGQIAFTRDLLKSMRH